MVKVGRTMGPKEQEGYRLKYLSNPGKSPGIDSALGRTVLLKGSIV